MVPATTTAYVRCKVLPGLFDTELYVLVNGASSAYVNAGRVRFVGTPAHNTPVDGTVLAYVITKRGDESLIELPGQPMVGGLRSWVPNNLLES